MISVYELTAEERVAAGAAELDRHVPGWASRVNPDSLDLESGRHCVLGQVYGEPIDADRRYLTPYHLGLAMLSQSMGLDIGYVEGSEAYEFAVAHGFMVNEDADEPRGCRCGADLFTLEHLWRQQIAERRS